MTIQNPLVANLLVAPIDATAAAPSISFGGSSYQNSGTGIYGSYGLISFAIDGVNMLNMSADGILGPTSAYAGSDSFQVLAIDLEVSGVGSNVGTDPAFIAPIMGNLLGDSVSGDGNYLGGVIGAISAQGVSSAYPTGGIVGIVMDSAGLVDAPVVSVIDGDDPSGVTLAGAMFKARQNNNNAGSGANYGLDLYDAGNANYTGGPVALSIKKADVRMTNQVCIMNGAGAPVDGTTGDNFAGTGSLYIDKTAGKLYINTGAITNPTWVVVGGQT